MVRGLHSSAFNFVVLRRHFFDCFLHEPCAVGKAEADRVCCCYGHHFGQLPPHEVPFAICVCELRALALQSILPQSSLVTDLGASGLAIP